MALFIGGPYDGQNLPVETGKTTQRLPDERDLQVFLNDPQATTSSKWPHVYRVDYSGREPVYRYSPEDE